MEVPKNTKLPRRFWDKISDTPDKNGCWLWIASRLPSGYGRLQIGTTKANNEVQYAHRLMYEDIHGAHGVTVIRHSCDNPPCVNPEHLFGGSWADNAQDRDRRGRSGTAILTDEKVIAIRKAGPPWKRKLLAKEHGVARATIDAVVTGRTWKHLL